MVCTRSKKSIVMWLLFSVLIAGCASTPDPIAYSCPPILLPPDPINYTSRITTKMPPNLVVKYAAAELKSYKGWYKIVKREVIETQADQVKQSHLVQN